MVLVALALFAWWQIQVRAHTPESVVRDYLSLAEKGSIHEAEEMVDAKPGGVVLSDEAYRQNTGIADVEVTDTVNAHRIEIGQETTVCFEYRLAGQAETHRSSLVVKRAADRSFGRPQWVLAKSVLNPSAVLSPVVGIEEFTVGGDDVSLPTVGSALKQRRQNPVLLAPGEYTFALANSSDARYFDVKEVPVRVRTPVADTVSEHRLEFFASARLQEVARDATIAQRDRCAQSETLGVTDDCPMVFRYPRVPDSQLQATGADGAFKVTIAKYADAGVPNVVVTSSPGVLDYQPKNSDRVRSSFTITAAVDVFGPESEFIFSR